MAQKLIKINTDHYVVVDDDGTRTHSTIDIKGVLPLPLQEVQELIGEVDVEKKAETKYPKSEFWVGSNPSRLYDENAKDRRCFLEGYNQALEDNKEKKYTEEDLALAWDKAQSWREDNNTWQKFLQYLQPKSRW